MDFSPTAHGSNRLTLYRDKFPDNTGLLSTMIVFFNTLSIWGGADESSNTHLSWELDKDIPEKVIIQSLKRLNYKI